MNNKIVTIGMGLAATAGVIVLQFILPFAFDFISTLGIYGLGVFAGTALSKK
jgi:hypothetical protein